jgi:hypothetical protein
MGFRARAIGKISGGKFGRITRFGGRSGGGSFTAVRSLVNFLGLRGSRARKIDTGTYLTYTKSWDATPYLQRLSIRYLSKRPEYNPGWAAMVNNMANNIKDGGYISIKITKNHTYSRPAGAPTGGPYHSVSYDVEFNENLQGATNHPDLMSNYIEELQAVMKEYVDCYKSSEASNVTSDDEWATRRAALEKYIDHVEETLDEID